MLTELKIELHLKSNQDINLSFWRLKQWKYLTPLKKKITKDKYGENLPHLEITEAVNIVNNEYIIGILSTIVINKIQDFYVHLFRINLLVNY